MANTIKLKRGTSTPSTSDISSGEVAIDTSAQKLYINDSGTVKEIGGSGSSIGGNTGVDFNDNVKARWGTGNDLELYHDGTYGWIANGTGDLLIKNDGTNPIRIRSVYNEENIVCYANGTTELYYDGVVKLQTQSWGVLINDQLKLTDSKSLFFGDGNDLQIYHDGSNSSIQNATGKLYLYGGSNQVLIKAVNAENSLTAKPNGAVELYYDDSKKLETSSTGVTVTGDIIPAADSTHNLGSNGTRWAYIYGDTISGNLYGNGANITVLNIVVDTSPQLGGNLDVNAKNILFGDSTNASDDRLIFGAGNDLQIYHDGSHSFIKNSTGNLQLMSDEFRVKSNTGNEAIIQASLNGSVQLYYDNVKSLETTSTGAKVNGSKLEVINTAGAGDSQLYLEAGEGGTAFIQFIADNGDDNTDKSRILQADGANLKIQNYDSGSWATKIETTSAGATVTGTCTATAFSGDGSGLTGVINDLVDDTSPQLGGNLDVNTKNILFGDSASASDDRLIFGAGSDLSIHSDGQNGVIRQNNDSGGLYIQTDNFLQIGKVDQSTPIYAKFINSGACELYYDNSKKFWTTNNGVEFDGYLTGNDSDTIQLGNGGDLKIFHDGSNSYINNGTGNLIIDGGVHTQFTNVHDEDTAKFIANGAVELYYDNSKKFETTSDGATFSGSVLFPDNQRIKIGGDASSPDIQIWHDGANNQYLNSTGDTVIQAGTANSIILRNNAAVELYNNGGKRFETTSNGITVQGPEGGTGVINLYADEGDDNADKWHFLANTDGTLLIRNLSDASWDTNIKCVGGGSTELYYDDSKKIDTNSGGVKVHGNIDIDDNNKLRVGTSSDLQIYHDGNNHINTTNGYLLIQVDNNNLYLDANQIRLRGEDGGEALAKFIDDGACELFYDNSKKLETTSDGINVDGFVYATRLDLDDNEKILLGTGDDLQLYHSGSHSYIRNDTGILHIDNYDGDIKIRPADGDTGIKVVSNGAVELYYDNDLRFYTSTYGTVLRGKEGYQAEVHIYGDEGDDNADKWQLHVGDAGFRILDYTSGSWEDNIECHGNGAVDLYYDNTKVLETSSTGIDLAASKDLKVQTTGKVKFGAGNADIKHTGTHFYFKSNTGDCYWDSTSSHYFRTNDDDNAIYCANNAHVSLYYDNSQKFYTQSYGCVVAGDLKPESNNTHDLGDSSYRWANLYVNDMHFSNEGKSNSVDGTWGDWTLQEGDENIFMINNRTGKKYKMGLQEVS